METIGHEEEAMFPKKTQLHQVGSALARPRARTGRSPEQCEPVGARWWPTVDTYSERSALLYGIQSSFGVWCRLTRCCENRPNDPENKDLRVRTWPRSIFMLGGATKAHQVL